MFTTRCFIRKNTPELQDKLKKLGYHICCCCKFKDNIWLHNFISDEHDRYEIHGLGAWDVEDNQEEVLNLFLIGNAEHPNPAIDCGENIDLFLAIASLRDDTDKYQWFTDGNITEMSTEDLPSKYMMMEGHKCTVEELIKIFNK